MSYRPELDPRKIIDFPLERARVHHLDVGLVKLKNALEQTPPDVIPAVPFFQSPAEIASGEKADQTNIDLAAVREEIQREAA